MIKYCSSNGCGFANQYSVTPPQKCAKCNTSFMAAFKTVVAVEDNDEDEKEVVVVKKKKTLQKPAPSSNASRLQKLRQAQRQTQADDEGEVEADDVDDESVAEEDDGGMSALSTDELIASLNPDDMLRVNTGGEGPVKLGAWVNQPK